MSLFTNNNFTSKFEKFIIIIFNQSKNFEDLFKRTVLKLKVFTKFKINFLLQLYHL